LAGDVASSGDMAYVYGRVKSVDTDQREVVSNYLRLLRRDEGGAWKIVLHVIRH
jgi:ketosteroid isomerase-like protein